MLETVFLRSSRFMVGGLGEKERRWQRGGNACELRFCATVSWILSVHWWGGISVGIGWVGIHGLF